MSDLASKLEGLKCLACGSSDDTSFYLHTTAQGSSCKECPEDAHIMTAVAGLAMVLGLYLLWRASSSATTLVAVLSIFYSNAQVQVYFVDIKMHWPPIISNIFRLVRSIVLLDIFSVSKPECAAAMNSSQRTAVGLLAPFAAILLVKVGCMLKDGGKAKASSGYLHLRNAILLAAYPTFASKVAEFISKAMTKEGPISVIFSSAFVACFITAVSITVAVAMLVHCSWHSQKGKLDWP